MIKALAERAGYDLQVRWRSVAAALALCLVCQWVGTLDCLAALPDSNE